MYEELNKYYRTQRIDVFAMIVTYILSKGTDGVASITEDEITEMVETLKEEEERAKAEGKFPIMTPDFQGMLIREAKKVVSLLKNPVELVQFCAIKGIFDLDWYAPGELTPREEELSRITYNAISGMICKDYYEEDDSSLESYLDTDRDTLVKFHLVEDEE